MTIKIETLPLTRLSMRHLSEKTLSAFRLPVEHWPAAGYEGFNSLMIYAHDENSGEPAIPDDMWSILEQARRARIEYVLFEEDLEPTPGLPVYQYNSNRPNGIDVGSIDVGDLFFAGRHADVSLVCVMRAFDDDSIFAHVYNLDVMAKFSRLSGRLIGFAEYGGQDANYLLRAERLTQLEWGQERVTICLIGDPDFDFGAAEESEAALEWARRQLAKSASTEVDDNPTPS